MATIFDGLAGDVADLLTDTATVYAQATTPPRGYTVPVKTGLQCLLTELVLRSTVPTAGGRDELASRRELYGLGTYTMPKNIRIQINGQAARWTLIDETVTPIPAGATAPELWHADVTVQQ